MSNKCIYCKGEIPVNKALSVCRSCGIKVWGVKMYESIDSQMASAKETGNLELGNVH